MFEKISQESLMLWVMHEFAKTFPEHAILRGGMVLNLLNCPRYTHDLDYSFVPYKSKKQIVEMINSSLSKLEDSEIKIEMHSTNARFILKYKNCSVIVEVNVDLKCKSEALSTSSLASKHQELPSIIRVMSLDWALSHKLAAWNERNLMRDLYDIYFIYQVLGEKPNIEILKKRLSNINYLGKTSKKNPKNMTLDEFCKKLESSIDQVNFQNLQQELKDYFPPEELPGLDKKIKVGIKNLIEFLRVSLIKC